MMIERTFTDRVALRRCISHNDYGTPEYSVPLQVKARVEPFGKLVRKRDGTEINTSYKVFTSARVQPDDEIIYEGEPYIVLSGGAVKDVRGKVTHYEVAM